MNREVIKVGGSLLTRANLRESVENWMESQPPSQFFMIVGGGDFIEALRELDSIHSFDPIEIHWRCIRLLDHTFELACSIFPTATAIASSELLRDVIQRTDNTPGFYLVRVASFYVQTSLSPMASRLPMDWTTTSDSLAILLGNELGADCVTLLKSCTVPPRLSLASYVEQGIVDPASLQIADHNTPIRVEELR